MAKFALISSVITDDMSATFATREDYKICITKFSANCGFLQKQGTKQMVTPSAFRVSLKSSFTLISLSCKFLKVSKRKYDNLDEGLRTFECRYKYILVKLKSLLLVFEK